LKKKLSLCYSIVYYYNGAQRYKQFLQVGRLYRGRFSSVFRAPVSSVVMVLYILKFFWLTSFSLSFSELSLVRLALDLID